MTGSDMHEIDTGSDSFSIVVDHYGDARGTRSQFQNSDPSAIDPLINENIAAYHLATETLTPQLASIRKALAACWQGSSADIALNILTQLETDAKTIGVNTKACHDSFVAFQSTWTNLRAQADKLYEGVAGTGLHEDNSGAHRIFLQFTDAMQTSMHAMPAHLIYTTPWDTQQAGPGPGPGGSGGPGFGGPGNPGTPGPGRWGVGSGGGGWPGPSSPGPGTPGPGFPGPGFPGPGFPGPGAPGLPGPGTGTYHGGNGGLGPGSAGLDTNAQLSSYTGGPGSTGPGFTVPGGPGPGFAGPGGMLAGATGTMGAPISGGGTVGAGAGVGGVGATNTGMRPMMGARGGAGGDDEDERNRSTWLSEEEGIWDGDTGAPPGVIA